MTLFGKAPGNYARFVRTGMIMIVLMGIARFSVGLSGVPYGRVTHLLSLSILTMVLAFIYGQKAAASKFGGYRQLLPMVLMLAAAMYGVIIPAILVEGAFGLNGYFHSQTLAHLGAMGTMSVLAHAGGQLLGMVIFTVPFCWGLASLGFLLSRHLHFLRTGFLLLAAMALFRVLVGAAGVPYPIGTWLTSLTILAIVLSIYYGYRAPTGGFSKYGHAVLLGALNSAFMTLLVIYGIAVTAGLGIPNYFHAPGEGFQPRGMTEAQHILGHLKFSLPGMLFMGLLATIGFAVGKRRIQTPSPQAA